MVKFGLIIGFYVQLLTFLGFFSKLSVINVGILSTGFVISCIVLKKNLGIEISSLGKEIKHPLAKIIFGLVVFLSIVNLGGALAPETAFDALWYHLTIPKLYLERSEIYFIPGGLLYYSGLPKLMEIIYLPVLMFTNEIGAKLVHFSFGVLSLAALFTLSKKYLNEIYPLLVVGIFAGNLVFAWESTTAFNDLAWTFYEILAFVSFTQFLKTRSNYWVVILGLMLGFAVLTKFLGVASVLVYLVLFIIMSNRKFGLSLIKHSIILISFSLLPSLPWFIFNLIHTGNPIYPFFTEYLSITQHGFSVDVIQVFKTIVFPADPISPLYLIFLPFGMILWNRFKTQERLAMIYVLLTFWIWLITGRVGGTRFLLSYLPVYSLAVVLIIRELTKNFGKNFYFLAVSFIALILITSIVYRSAAQLKSLPYLLGQESNEEYLQKNLKFSFGNFYDTDGYLARNIKENDRVLLVGLHNLYYVNFPYVHTSWYKGEDITHILVQNTQVPTQYKNWHKVYSNTETNIILYKNPK